MPAEPVRRSVLATRIHSVVVERHDTPLMEARRFYIDTGVRIDAIQASTDPQAFEERLQRASEEGALTLAFIELGWRKSVALSSTREPLFHVT